MTNEKTSRRLSNYLRRHRRRSSLSQRELGHVLGYGNEGCISRHESFRILPSLEIAIGYEVVFRVPVSELFAGLRDEVTEDVEARLAQLEQTLGQRSFKDGNGEATARKLMWLCERKGPQYRPLP